MRKEIVNPFITAAATTFAKDFNVKWERKSITKKDAPIPTLEVSVSIGITGGLRGSVVFSMNEPMATSIARVQMPSGTSAEQVQKFVSSAVGEMANVICGLVIIELSELGLECDITPPTVMEGSVRLNFLSAETICVVGQSELGELEINIAVVE